ncbi:MAG: biopolymer transporter ExbD [Gemmatimonadaceae bacterium]|nr:biopolymer transporter ExbD [Gemmatimonadaceae bacterium]
MRRGRRGERMGVNGEINVVSLIDVMMLLMVIFMITAPIMTGGVDVSLPKADVAPLEPKSGLVVTIDRRGKIFIDDVPMSFAEFSGAIKALHEKKGGGGVLVRGDEGAQYGIILRVVAAMKSQGITEVGLMAEPEENR